MNISTQVLWYWLIYCTVLCFPADPKREAFTLESHTNETVGEAKARIAEKLQLSLASLSFISVRPGQSICTCDIRIKKCERKCLGKCDFLISGYRGTVPTVQSETKTEIKGKEETKLFEFE